jgi:hypothetical protein
MLIPCPTCGKQCRIPDRALGKSVKCHGCGTTFRAGEEPEQVQEQAGPKSPAGRPVARPRRPEYADDDEDNDEDEVPRFKPPSSRSQAKAAALWFLLAGIMTIVMVVLLLIGFFVLTKGNRNITLAHALGFFFRLLLVANAGAWHFLAFTSLKTFETKRNVLIALILGYVLALLLGVDAAILAFHEDSPGALVAVIVGLEGITALLNLVAAVLGTIILSQRKVVRRFQ